MDAVKKAGGRCVKMDPQNYKGIPDRLILLRGGLFFVELKTKIGRPSPMQIRWSKFLQEVGVLSYIISGKDELDNFLKLKGLK